MQSRIIKGDKVRPLDGKFKGQEGTVVDVLGNPAQRIRVCFPDYSLEIYDSSQVEFAQKKFNFQRFVKEQLVESAPRISNFQRYVKERSEVFKKLNGS
jgi:hypothetical protein